MEFNLDYAMKKIGNHKPKIAIILGSGFSDVIDCEVEDIIKYKELGFEYVEVKGHKKQFVFGKFKGVEIVILSRFHYYETGSAENLKKLFKLLSLLGVKVIIATTATGGVNENFEAGDLMLVKDHINLTGYNPLIAQHPVKFVDLTRAYDRKYIDLIQKSAKKLNIDLKTGVHVQTSGPTYETPAEVKMYRLLGGDTVSMSLAYGCICARNLGIKYIAFAGVTNKAQTEDSKPLAHEEVLKVSKKISKVLKNIIEDIIPKL